MLDRTIRVLVVDDEPTLVEMTSELIRDIKNVEVIGMSDSLVALEKLTTNQYDVVVTDMMMPNLCGDALVEQAKPYQSEKTVYICITGTPDNISDKFLFDHIFGKPFDVDALIQVISSI